MIKKILLIEDNSDLRSTIEDYFSAKSNGEIIIKSATSRQEADSINNIEEYSLILLDIMLPGADGFSLCKKLRSKTNCPLIFITALGSESDKIKGYSLGADDYVVKPFSLPELYMKVNAWLRRSYNRENQSQCSFENITIDLNERSCIVDGDNISLTQIEFEILRLLMENQGRVLSRKLMLEHIWPDTFDVTERAVDNHIKNLRKALGSARTHIKTIHGLGYCLKK